jgi:prophage antirepressor-like protein
MVALSSRPSSTSPTCTGLILKSQLPAAQDFERWVIEKVIPTIRKTGSYSVTPERPKSDMELMHQGTGYFKVVFKLATEDTPAFAIGFLI